MTNPALAEALRSAVFRRDMAEAVRVLTIILTMAEAGEWNDG